MGEMYGETVFMSLHGIYIMCMYIHNTRSQNILAKLTECWGHLIGIPNNLYDILQNGISRLRYLEKCEPRRPQPTLYNIIYKRFSYNYASK